jgi:hypothetical protein
MNTSQDNNNLAPNNENENPDLSDLLETNMFSILGTSCTLLDMARNTTEENTYERDVIDEIIGEIMGYYDELDTKISQLHTIIDESEDTSNTLEEFLILGLQNDICNNLAESVSEVDRIYRDNFS